MISKAYLIQTNKFLTRIDLIGTFPRRTIQFECFGLALLCSL